MIPGHSPGPIKLRPGPRSHPQTSRSPEKCPRTRGRSTTALSQGWPIATGIVEGACRHLIQDRMDITGARWGLAGAEAILKLRALKANGDFDAYWRYHLAQEHHHVHQTRYHNHAIPRAE